MNKAVQERFDEYPEEARLRLEVLRSYIYELADVLALGQVEESLKWGEPSYRVKSGSPIRMDWKATSPQHYCLFFHCQTKLVDTFRALHGDELVFEGNRAIVLDVPQPIPEFAIKHCLELALTYHQRKNLPLLGA